MLDDLRYLVLSVETGSFAGAARRLGVTPSAVSRRIAHLERELGVALLARTTRALRLTLDGMAFHDRCVHALQEIDEARDALANAKTRPSGLLRVETSTTLGRVILAPALPRFLDRYPDVQVNLTLRDQLVDPIVEGVDVLVRVGQPADSDLISRKLGEARLVRCASPAYLRKHRAPKTPADLEGHACLGYLDGANTRPFTFPGPEGLYARPFAGPCNSNDSDVLKQLAIAGRGIATLFDFMVRDALDSGQLEMVLGEYASPPWPIHALFPSKCHILPRVRAFLDYLPEAFSRASARA